MVIIRPKKQYPQWVADTLINKKESLNWSDDRFPLEYIEYLKRGTDPKDYPKLYDMVKPYIT